jgi:hypothetical protein
MMRVTRTMRMTRAARAMTPPAAAMKAAYDIGYGACDES